jgi:hypothetical protein
MPLQYDCNGHTTGVKGEESDQVNAIPLVERKRIRPGGGSGRGRNLWRGRNQRREGQNGGRERALGLLEGSGGRRGGRERRGARVGGRDATGGAAGATRTARLTLGHSRATGQDALRQHQQHAEQNSESSSHSFIGASSRPFTSSLWPLLLRSS